MCALRLPLWAKLWGQKEQGCGFSLVCFIMWILRAPFWLNALGHIVHLKGRSPGPQGKIQNGIIHVVAQVWYLSESVLASIEHDPTCMYADMPLKLTRFLEGLRTLSAFVLKTRPVYVSLVGLPRQRMPTTAEQSDTKFKCEVIIRCHYIYPINFNCISQIAKKSQ